MGEGYTRRLDRPRGHNAFPDRLRRFQDDFTLQVRSARTAHGVLDRRLLLDLGGCVLHCCMGAGLGLDQRHIRVAKDVGGGQHSGINCWLCHRYGMGHIEWSRDLSRSDCLSRRRLGQPDSHRPTLVAPGTTVILHLARRTCGSSLETRPAEREDCSSGFWRPRGARRI